LMVRSTWILAAPEGANFSSLVVGTIDAGVSPELVSARAPPLCTAWLPCRFNFAPQEVELGAALGTTTTGGSESRGGID
jgi:hypothetical protein